MSREQWKKWVTINVATFVYKNMPYNSTGKKHEAQYGRSIGLHEVVDHKLATCRHHALMTQVLQQSFGITSRLMKSNVEYSNGNGGAHVNNLERIEGQWYLLDSTSPELQPDGTGKIFIKPLPDNNIDLNTKTYQWAFQEIDGKNRKYQSRANMYWYIKNDTEKNAKKNNY